MTDIFDELNEDYRAERARALALRYGAFGGVLLVLLLAGVGGWQAWRWRQDREAARTAMPFLAAMASADALPPGLTQTTPSPARASAADAFAAVAATAPEGYRTLAQLREAPLRDGTAPAALYDAVAADPAADPALRDLATLLWAQRQVDGGDPAAAAARLRPLEAGPWRALAQETEALLDLRRDDKDAAVALLRTLAADPAAAEGVRGRAAKLLGFLGGAEARG